MATTDQIVAAYGQTQQKAVMQAVIRAEQLWRTLSTADLSGSWMNGVGAALTSAVAAGQLLAASTAQAYVNAMVAADGLDNDYAHGADTVNYRQLSGTSADGRPLDSLMYLPVIRTKTLLAGGVTLPQAMIGGMASLTRIVASEVADAGSGAASVAMVANRTVTGYIRKIRPGACARCAILAGKWYRYNADFDRHAHCQCYGVASTKARHGTPQSPMGFFDGLSRAEQDRRFGAADAEAIRNGADISKVVNAHRGVITVDAYGRKVVATLEGTTKRGAFFQQMRRETEQRTGQRFARTSADVEQGLPRFRLQTPRLMPSEILELAEDRDELIRLLERFGYLG